MTTEFAASPVGNEISCVLHGVSADRLAAHTDLERLLIEALQHEGLTVLQTVSHAFEPAGFTAVALLAESHAALHTYPEYGSLFFYLYSCRGPDDGRRAFAYLCQALGPEFVDQHERPIVVQADEA